MSLATENLIYLFLCDRYKNYILLRNKLLAFERSTSYFGTLHTAREISVFVKLVRSHFVRSFFNAKTEISLHVWFFFSHMPFWYSKPSINKLGQKRPKKANEGLKKALKAKYGCTFFMETICKAIKTILVETSYFYIEAIKS